MRVIIGSFQCEGNSLTPIHTTFEDFDYAVGEAMHEKLAVIDFFKEHNCEVIPTIYAHAIPGGAVVKEDYLRMAKELVDAISSEDVDGIWLSNCIKGFRTAPHCDHKDTQIRAAKKLLQCIEKNILLQPQMARVDIVIYGDAVLTSQDLLKSIMEMAVRRDNGTSSKEMRLV